MRQFHVSAILMVVPTAALAEGTEAPTPEEPSVYAAGVTPPGAKPFAQGTSGCDNFIEGKEGLWRCSWGDHLSLGPGVGVVSFNLGDGTIGLLDTISPVQLSFSTWQYRSIAYKVNDDGTREKEIHKYAFWEFGLGLTLSKDQESDTIHFGANVIPLEINIDDKFSLGVGVNYELSGKVEWGIDRMSVILPISYNIGPLG